MKCRAEQRGYHFYDRSTGRHVLVDEIQPPESELSAGPAVVSIALTNSCDLACEHCYAPKSPHELKMADVLAWSSELDALGTLEIAFGGGEPTRYMDLAPLCRAIWTQCELGISITTHGHDFSRTLAAELRGFVSIVRFSIDGIGDVYTQMRGCKIEPVLDAIRLAQTFTSVGVNTVINSRTLPNLSALADYLRYLGVSDWLLLPEIRNGACTLSPLDWATFDAWLSCRPHDFRISVSHNARGYLSCPFLFADASGDGTYAHISADGCLSSSSYYEGGLPLNTVCLKEALARIDLG